MALVFAVDTSCVIAAMCGWHAQHRAAAAEIGRRQDAGEQLAVAAHALSEAYAVLTRLPAPYRLTPTDAWHGLNANFTNLAFVVTLTAAQHVALLGRLAKEGIGGGRTYDAIIAECALKAGAATLLTFNARHFDPAPKGVAVVVPA